MTTHLPTHAEVLDAAQLLREYFQSMPCGQASLPRIAAMLERLAPLLDASAGGVSDAVVDNFREAYFDAADIPDVLTDKVAVRAALTSVLPLLRAGDRCAEFHLALQRIGTALGLLAGSDLTKECVPAIERLRAERAKGEAVAVPRELEPTIDVIDRAIAGGSDRG